MQVYSDKIEGIWKDCAESIDRCVNAFESKKEKKVIIGINTIFVLWKKN